MDEEIKNQPAGNNKTDASQEINSSDATDNQKQSQDATANLQSNSSKTAEVKDASNNEKDQKSNDENQEVSTSLSSSIVDPHKHNTQNVA